MDDDLPVLIAGGSLVGLSTALLLGRHGVPLAGRRAPPGHGDPSSRRARQPAHDRDLPRRRARARDHGGLGARVRPERRHRVGRVACRTRARVLLPQHQRGRRDPEPVAAPVRHADRTGADSASGTPNELGARVEWGTELVSFEQDDDGVSALVRARDGGERAHGARPLPRRRGRQPQPCARAARRSRSARARQLLEQHHDLLPRRRPPAASATATSA